MSILSKYEKSELFWFLIKRIGRKGEKLRKEKWEKGIKL